MRLIYSLPLSRRHCFLIIFTGSTELVAVTPAHRVYYRESMCASLQFITMDAAMALPLIVSPIFHSLAFAEWNIGEIL